MKKMASLAVVAALALATVGARAEKLPPLPDGAFTYVVIPDTQLYRGEGAHVKKGKKPQAGPTRNPAFASRIDWIAANIEKEKIAFVSHVGDIVDFRNAAQWAFASNQMAKLDGKVPYGISPGNHDIGGADTTEFNTWFPRARYETNTWYAGSFGGYVNAKGKRVCAGNADSCQLFEAGGMKFVVLHLECNAPAPVLTWVDQMLEKYADRFAIICTHMYLGYATKEIDERRRTAKERPNAWFGVMDWTKCHGTEGVSAAKAWETCFSKHKNLILIVSGDQSPAICWRVTQRGVHGNTVHATLQDYPRTADTEDWLRLYRFRPAERRIDVWTYSPQQDRVCDAAGFRTGRDWHVFTLPLPLEAFNPYGVVTDGSRSEYDMHDDLADLIKVGGMGYERVDWDWRACQKEKDGAFDFSRYDKIVEADEARGVTVLPIVYGPPDWASPAWQHLDGYAAFVRETVRRYGKRMPVIEIWNEQNIAGFWKNPNPTNYLALLKVAYKAAKEVDPSIRVALGGTAGWAHGFIRSLYAIGAKDYFDIVNVHPYCYPYPPEEPLRKGFEELRKIMAEYGDAEKPIWFTEIGWPTHEVDNTGPGHVLLAGLKTARPEKTAWNVICVVCKPDGEQPDQRMAESLLARLPPGSKVRVCAPKETCEQLAAGGWDAVVYPFDESYPADTLDAVVEFVRKGGTLIDLGGMPMWNPYRNLPDGSGQKIPHDGGRERFKRLKIGLDSWWLPGSELPKTDNYPMKVYATPEGLAAGVKQSPTGFPCSHFFTAKALGPNDRMVPLIAGTNPLNGKPAVAACTYLLDGDMKGRVVVCGIQKGSGGSAFPVSEHQQGVMFARAMGISFAEGVEAFFWYSLRARETDRYYNEHHFGMVHANLVPKDGWLANKMFITQRPAGSANLGGEWRKDGIFFPQWKRPDGKVGGMIWTDRAARGLSLTFDADDIAFHDMWGKPAPVHGTGRTRRVQVTGEPLYFTGARLLSFLPDDKTSQN